MIESVLNMCVFNGQRDFGTRDLARKQSVDFVTDKYSKEDLV